MKPGTLNIGPGSIVKVNDVSFCVKGFETSDSVLARNIETSEDKVIAFREISESSS